MGNGKRGTGAITALAVIAVFHINTAFASMLSDQSGGEGISFRVIGTDIVINKTASYDETFDIDTNIAIVSGQSPSTTYIASYRETDPYAIKKTEGYSLAEIETSAEEGVQTQTTDSDNQKPDGGPQRQLPDSAWKKQEEGPPTGPPDSGEGEDPPPEDSAGDDHQQEATNQGVNTPAEAIVNRSNIK